MTNERLASYFRDKRVQSAMLLSLLGILVFLLSRLTPWLFDDILYQYIFEDHFGAMTRRIGSLRDVIMSQYNHYYLMNGRVVAHTIAQIYDGLLGQTLFSISNAIVYILFIRVLMLTCGVRMDNRGGLLTLICLVLLCLPMRFTTVFQMYIWMYLLILTFVYLFMRLKEGRWYATVLLCVFSLIAGNAHESLAPGIITGLAVYLAVNIRKATLRQWLMALFFVAGFIIISLSPATMSRVGGVPFPIYLESRAMALAGLLKASPAFFVLCGVAAYKIIVKRVSPVRMVRDDYFWWTVWLTCVGVNVIMGFNGIRTQLGEETVAIVLIVRLMSHKSFTRPWLFAFLALTVAFVTVQSRKIFITGEYVEEVHRQVVSSKDGNVYLNPSYAPPVAGLEEYVSRLEIRNYLDPEVDEDMLMFALNFGERWGTRNDFKIYPTALRPYIECTADTTDGNMAVEFVPGSWLLVQNKRHPARFQVEHRRVTPFPPKNYPPKDYELDRRIFENDYWRASIVWSDFYSPFYPARFFVIPPKE